MPTPPQTSTTAITGSAPAFNSHTRERRVQPRSALSLHTMVGVPRRVSHPRKTLPFGLGPALPRTPPQASPSPIARMTSAELSLGAQGPRSPLPPAPERAVPRRRLGVRKISTPGLVANSQVPPLAGAAGLLPETFKAPLKVSERRHSENSAPPSDLVISRVKVEFGHFPCL